MIWIAKDHPPKEAITTLQQELQIPSVNAHLLIQRGLSSFDSAKTYFRPKADQLHDPFLMDGMQKAVQRIEKALSAGEKILIYGDYDVDGTTAVALLYTYLSNFSDRVKTYIPDRYKEGYGISFQGIDYAEQEGFQLMIALDCGIKALEQVAYAKQKGIDFIIGDHHKPGSELPEAYAILNPKKEQCPYPYKELCGCGIAFKLVQGIHQQRQGEWSEILPLLDLVVTATAADIVPLTGENRTLAALGLQQFQQAARPGLQALMGERKKPYRISDVVFGVAPRINAAGRMEHARIAVELLTSAKAEEGLHIAQRIEQFNQDRRSVEQQITQEALDQIIENQEEKRTTTVVFHKDWHKGVIGIVASRLIEKYYRPTVVCCLSGDTIVASVRSVRGFDVYQALEACSEHLLQFGGHKYAAGLSLHPSKFEDFKNHFEKIVANQILPEQQLPQLTYDLDVSFDMLTPKVYRIIQQMRPFGPGNMRPVFLTRGCTNAGFTRLVGQDKTHLKLDATDASGRRFSGIGFGLATAWEKLQNQSFDLVYCLEENTFNDRTTLELQVKDIRPSQAQNS